MNLANNKLTSVRSKFPHAHTNTHQQHTKKILTSQGYLAALNTTTTIIIISFRTFWTDFCFECNISRAACVRSRFDFDEYEPTILMISSVYFQSFQIMTLPSIPLIYRSIFHNFFIIYNIYNTHIHTHNVKI